MIQDFKIMQLHERYEEYSENCKDNGYDEIITVEVEADSERQAIELAENRAEDISLTSADNVELTESCVTNIEEMQCRANQ